MYITEKITSGPMQETAKEHIWHHDNPFPIYFIFLDSFTKIVFFASSIPHLLSLNNRDFLLKTVGIINKSMKRLCNCSKCSGIYLCCLLFQWKCTSAIYVILLLNYCTLFIS